MAHGPVEGTHYCNHGFKSCLLQKQQEVGLALALGRVIQESFFSIGETDPFTQKVNQISINPKV